MSLTLHTRSHKKMKTLFFALIFGVTAATLMSATIPAYAAEPVQQCNDANNVGGEAIECNVTVTNNVDLATNTATSVVEVENCVGFAGAELTCTNSILNFQEATVEVNQCNGSGSGGGGTVTCRVSVVNNIVGNATATPATVNQCVGSGEDGGTEPTLICDPQGSTTNATVTQCNGSGNGGGGTERVLCTVETSTETASLPVTVNQCNGSGNGGGAVVICSTVLTNNIVAAPEEETPPTDGGTTPPTDGGTAPPVDGGTPPVDGNVPPVAVPPVDSGTPPVAPPVDGNTPPDVVTPPVVETPVTPPVNDTPPGDNQPPVYSSKTPPNLAYTGSESLTYGAIAVVVILAGAALTVFSKKQLV